MKPDKDETESTIWRCAAKRTSTRDIGVVFSIMGLFGLQLDPSHYTTRSEALLSLLQRSMANGNRANWLATSLSSSSIIPHFSTSGRTPLSSITSLDDNSREPSIQELVWYLSGAPIGTLDDAGALKIVVSFSQVEINQVVKSRNNGLCFGFDATLEVHGASRSAGIFLSGQTGTHAAKLGTIVLYSTTAVARFLYLEDTLVMLLDRVAGKWCKKGMAAVPSELTNGWEEQEVIIVGKN
ncbi:hypothetical protein BDZ94DRAFT_1250319 [Collybia nuda]|uniref:Uncharacterized protein n=1 Tax=Collybia nuda TaxID=64659 RepID=A0A9P5YFQ4_9AGAR|nr:hypothetical protein BDZ94DRAFT_1250319 [Collybia nuda]